VDHIIWKCVDGGGWFFPVQYVYAVFLCHMRPPIFHIQAPAGDAVIQKPLELLNCLGPVAREAVAVRFGTPTLLVHESLIGGRLFTIASLHEN